jgi:hypothetical protein
MTSEEVAERVREIGFEAISFSGSLIQITVS